MDSDYKIGVEVELLLAAKDPGIRSIEDFSKMIVSGHCAGDTVHDMHCDLDSLPYFGEARFSEWTLHEDCSIEEDGPRQFAIELSSPAMFFSLNFWKSSVIEVFDLLRGLSYLSVNNSCGFHVHVSRDGHAWTLEDLKRISRAIIYFETSIEVIVPEHRRNNMWAKNNFTDNFMFENKSEEEGYQLIGQCKTINDLIRLMNCGNDRNFAFNMQNIVGDDKFTIEFRRGPGLTRPHEVFQWVEFVVRFLNSARHTASLWDLRTYDQSVGGLYEFLIRHNIREGDASSLVPLFANKQGDQKPTKIGPPTAAQAARLQKKNDEAMRKNQIRMKWAGM